MTNTEVPSRTFHKYGRQLHFYSHCYDIVASTRVQQGVVKFCTMYLVFFSTPPRNVLWFCVSYGRVQMKEGSA